MKKLLLTLLILLPALACGQQIKISNLPVGGAITGTEAIPVTQGLVTVKTTPAAIATYIFGGGAPGIAPVPNGGTGVATLPTSLLLGNGVAPVTGYAGTSCINQFPRSLSAVGTATCASVANTDLVNSSITLNGTSVALGGTRTLTLASADFVNQGTASTVLHGNAAGNPSFGAVQPADVNTAANFTWTGTHTFSLAPTMTLGITQTDRTAPSNPSAGNLNVYSLNSGASNQSQLTTLDSNGVAMIIGFENHMVVYNQSGATIPVGQLVYISGSHAAVPAVALAQANSAATLPAVGFTQYAIANNSYGQIHVSGSVASTTTGFSDGDTIYVSPTTPGAFVNVAPSAVGQYVQQVGVVTNGGVGAGAGRLQFLFLNPLQAVRSVATGGTGVATLPSALLVGNGTSAVTGYAGTSCTNQFPRSLSALGAATCASVAPADINTAANFTWTGNHTYTPAAGTAITATDKTGGGGIVISATAANAAGIVLAGNGNAIGTAGNIYQDSTNALIIGNFTAASAVKVHSAGADQIVITGAGVLQLPNLGSSSAAQTGTLCWAATAVTYDPTLGCLASSIRFKEHVENLDIGLTELMRIRPVSYDLRSQYNPAHLGRQVGMIAEEVAKIDPRLVGYEADGKTPRGIRYAQYTALLTKAIQEQQQEIVELRLMIALVFAIGLAALVRTLYVRE